MDQTDYELILTDRLEIIKTINHKNNQRLWKNICLTKENNVKLYGIRFTKNIVDQDID